MNSNTNNTAVAANNTDVITLFNEKIAKNERVTLTHLAKEAGVTPAQARRSLCFLFGPNIVFKRGRTGGVSLL
jgi:hypothetical protein